MVAVKVVEGAAHCIKAGIRINKHSLRSVKGLAGLQLPAEVFRIDSHYGTQVIELTLFNISNKVARINKVDSVNTAVIVRGIVIQKCNKRMLLMAGLAAVRRNSLFSHVDRVAVYVTLAGPGTVEGNNIKIVVINIKGKRKCLFDKEGLAAFVCDFH